MSTLKVPFAFDINHNLIKADEAKKDQQYFCPGCEELLILKKGERKAAHYPHKESDICTQEKIIRQAAKYCVKNAVSGWKNSGLKAPVLIRECQACWGEFDQALPEKVEAAEIDFEFGEHRLDIALMENDGILAAMVIDIGQTLDQYERLSLGIPHISIDGWKVIDNPSLWKVEIDAFRLFVCKKCKMSFRRFQEKVLRVSEKTGIKIPNEYYRYSVTYCWKCRTEFIVFAWPGHGHQTMDKPKKEPVPSTIQDRFSKTAGHKYWANICPKCRMIQGSFYLHGEPGAPFCNIDCEDDTVSYQKDMYRIAYYSENACFTCITGEAAPDSDYEIDEACN